MRENKRDLLYDKISELERKKEVYLELEDKAAVRRIEKQIEKAEMEIKLLNLSKLEKELKVYKKVVSNYPGLECEIKQKLLEIK